VTWALEFRPHKLTDLVGQRHAAVVLAKILQKHFTGGEGLPAGFLFQGSRGLGKTSAARILAAALNCTQREDFEPCGKCASCRDVWRSSSMSVVELDGASNNSVDDMRSLKLLSIEAHPGLYRVIIIDEAHSITREGFNALLKVLEEPPPEVLFVLATTDPHRIIDTILSRLMRFDFRRVPDDLVVERLVEIAGAKSVEYDEEALPLISQHAEGGMRDAIMLFEQLHYRGRVTAEAVRDVTGTLQMPVARALAEALVSGRTVEGLQLVRDAYARVLDAQAVLDGLLYVFRDVVVAGLDPSRVTLSDTLKSVPQERALLVVEKLWDVKGKLRYSGVRNLQILEVTYVMLASLFTRAQAGAGPFVQAKVVVNPKAVPNGAPPKVSTADVRALFDAD
jgi:DNA polymerase-3 subunit gamma/tau